MAADPALVNAIRVRTRTRKTTRVGRGVRPPLGPEVAYRQSLDILTRSMKDVTQQVLFPLLTELEPQYITDTPRQEALQVVATLEGQFSSLDEQADRAAALMTEDVSNRNANTMHKDFERAFGIDLPGIIRNEGLQDVLNESISDNVSLIKSIPEQYFGKLNEIVGKGIVNRQRAVDIRAELKNLFGVTERRARLIARDQVSKLNGAITELRYNNLGIERYIWQTREDDRVRPTHQENEGKTFTWASPPVETGHPGHDINCRCIALPIIDLG